MGCDRAAAPPLVEVERATVTLPPIPSRPGAAYFTLRSNRTPASLVSVTSPLVERIELHESMTRRGMSGMAPLENSEFPGDGRLVFKPGGKHAMLFGIHPSVKAGGTIPLTFTFDPAPARPPRAAEPRPCRSP
jgi:copper(I)-binding protein